MQAEQPQVTIITPTIGNDSLFELIDSITQQDIPVTHLLLWDDARAPKFATPSANTNASPFFFEKEEFWKNYKYRANSIVVKGNMVQGVARGSALRAVGLMCAQTEFVTFADDDVMWEPNHLKTMLAAIQNKNWCACRRRIWTTTSDNQFEYLGVDNFESVGEHSTLPYKMIDNNCMMFRRRFGTSAAVLYRETPDYNDDRLMYAFLMQHAGAPVETNLATVNQVCPKKLVDFFRKGCTLSTEDKT